MINYTTIEEFNRDLKNLKKRFRTLDKDIETLKQYALEPYYEKGIKRDIFVPIEGFCGENYTANKVRKFACMSLAGRGNNSGIRIIFVWEEDIKQITFIEIYFKGDKENEDRKRLQNFIKKFE